VASWAILASSNHLLGPGRSVALRMEAGPFTVLGNIVTGPGKVEQSILVNGLDLTPPWAPLNVLQP
jgi:hypothetical protein